MSEPFYDPSDRPDDDLTREEFESAMNDRPTPITDANRKRICGNRDHQGDHVREFVPAEVCAGLERQLAAKTEECEGWEKQWREAAMNALTDQTRDELAEARAVIRKMELAIQHHEKRADKALEIAAELIAMIRVNVMRGTFREATIEQVDDHLKPWIQRIATINETTQ